jgi:alkanesulfonate monooxygenase SsuD/methylene tetrahydromethanopterin reductase-like flavin-dependent oxidoreductase (luciferase family)
MTAALTQVTERCRFLLAFRPGFTSPTLAAQMAATFQRVSVGRLLLNVVTGGDDREQRRFGDTLSKDERYARAREFLTIVRRLWEEESVDFAGEHYTVPDHLPPEYHELGIDEFIFSGYPHLEEAYRVGEGVIPRAPPVGPDDGVRAPGAGRRLSQRGARWQRLPWSI